MRVLLLKLFSYSVRQRLLKLLRVAFYCAIGGWIVVALYVKYLPPPFTPLMLIRYLEADSAAPGRGIKWRWVPLTDIPIHVQQAVVAAEDARFTTHYGLDIQAVQTVLRGTGSRRVRGASTITMQTVKNIFLWPGRSYLRKGLETVMTPPTELLWGKHRTLELYLNVIEWGDGVYGIEAAAQTYFNRPAKKLTPRQAAALAAVLPSPLVMTPHELTPTARLRYDRIIDEYNEVALPR